MSEAATDAEETPDFGPKAVRRRLPSDLSRKQSRAAVCLIRNPDAAFRRIAEETNTSENTVIEALRGIVYGQAAGEGMTDGTVWERRGGELREAESYDELSPKQQAIIDWLARHPGNLTKLLDGEDGELTGANVADAIGSNDRYEVAVSRSYPIRVAQQYTNLVRKRREDLAAAGELEDEDVAVESIRDLSPREWLNRVDVALPDENLDDLEMVSEPEMTDQERLEEAWQRAQAETEEEPVTEADRREYSAPLSCPNCSHEDREDFCSKCGTDKRYEWAIEDEDDEVIGPEASEPKQTGVEALFEEDKALSEVKGEIGRLHERLNNLEDRAVSERDLAQYHSEQEERLAEFEETVMDTLRNSVKVELVDEVETLRHDVNDLHERTRTLEAGTSETASLTEEVEDRLAALEADVGKTRAGLDRLMDAKDGRLALLISDLLHYADTEAYIKEMDVDASYSNVSIYQFKVHHGGRTPRKRGEEDE